MWRWGDGEGGRERETDRQTERKRERGALQHPATRAFEVQLADPLLMFERIRACLPSAHRCRPPVELVSRAGRSTASRAISRRRRRARLCRPPHAILARGVSLPVQGGPVPSAATLIPAPAGEGTTESSALGGRKLADGGYR